MKDRFNAPIIFDYQAGGYRFDKLNVGPAYALPGLWFNADETYALLTMHRLLSELEPGLLAPHVGPLLSRLNSILAHNTTESAQVNERIQLTRIGKRLKIQFILVWYRVPHWPDNNSKFATTRGSRIITLNAYSPTVAGVLSQ